MDKTLKIVTWNANGLSQSIPELEIFLNSEKIDICLIAESHFTQKSYIKLRGYCCYNAIHPANRARGGATIIIRENIKHYEETKTELETMQIASVIVQLNNYKTVRIASIYCPPRHQLKKIDYIEMFDTMGPSFILGGDFNAKNTFWGSRLTSPKGKELLSAAQQLKCDFFSGGAPTYWPSDTKKIPDLIDFFIAKGIAENYIHVENSDALSSDHSPVILIISETIILKEKPPRLYNNRTNWLLFMQLIEDNIDLQVPIKNNTQLEEEVELLITTIQKAAWNSTPFDKKTTEKNITYTEEIRNLVAKKRKARKTWHNTRAPENKTIYNQLKNKLSLLIHTTKCEALNEYLCHLSNRKENDYSLWKATKGLKRPKTQIPPIKKEDSTWARCPKEKAQLFANHLEGIFKPLPRQTAEENTHSIPRNDEQEIRPVKIKELKHEIKNLDTKKSPGYDLITGKIFQHLPDKGLKKLLHIINASF